MESVSVSGRIGVTTVWHDVIMIYHKPNVHMARNNNIIMTSKKTSFWRQNDVIIALCVRWEAEVGPRLSGETAYLENVYRWWWLLKYMQHNNCPQNTNTHNCMTKYIQFVIQTYLRIYITYNYNKAEQLTTVIFVTTFMYSTSRKICKRFRLNLSCFDILLSMWTIYPRTSRLPSWHWEIVYRWLSIRLQ